MWKKIKEILSKHTVANEERTFNSINGPMTASVIDLRPSPTTSLARTETLHHQLYYKLDEGRHTLSKTNEHCRSLFNLLPTSLRLRHRRSTLNKKSIDASTQRISIVDMSENLLNPPSSYNSSYSTAMPITRSGSIENFLHGHSKTNPANLRVLIRKSFQPFAQAHLAVTQGTILTALYSRGPWIYVRIDSNGKMGYIPRIICSIPSSMDQPPINRYLSHSSAIINDPQLRMISKPIDQHDNYTLLRLPPPPTRTNETLPPRDTDSSSTQDSGYSDSTPFYLVQQVTPEKEQASLHPIIHSSQKSNRRSSHLKIPDSINPSQPHRCLPESTTKRHSFGIFEPTISTRHVTRRLPEFALIRNVRQEKNAISNLPKSHVQIPASIFLNHHRQKQQFGSSHSAFRPVQPSLKHKRASSEGHSPSISTASSSSLSVASSNSSLNLSRRRLSCDLPLPIFSKSNSNSLTRSVCDPSSPSKKLHEFSRTMSDILCDQFSEINLDAIEKDSLMHQYPTKKSSQSNLFTVVRDYRSSRASFAVKRGEYVHVLKQVGRGCYLVRKHSNGQIGFLPKTLIIPVTSTKIETFLEMHGYRETII